MDEHTEQNCWFFITNPVTTFRIFDWWQVIGDEDNWTVSDQYQNQVCKGDMAAIWVAGGDDIAGIYRIAEVSTNPMMMTHNSSGPFRSLDKLVGIRKASSASAKLYLGEQVLTIFPNGRLF
jgi:hypothetical protein